jgi:hypothetical protein
MALSISDFIPGAEEMDNRGIRIDFDTLIKTAKNIKVDLTFKNLETKKAMVMVSATTCEDVKFYAWIEQKEWETWCADNNLCHKCGAEKEDYPEDDTVWRHCPKGCLDPEFIRTRREVIPPRRSPGIAANLCTPVEFCK